MKLTLSKLQIKILIACLLVIIFCFLLAKFQSIDFIQHDRFSGNLRQLNQIDATLNKDVFELRYGVLTHYDTLVNNTEKIKRLEKAVIPGFIDAEGQNKLRKLLADYSELQKQKTILIENFKSKNAILKNSLYYLPVLVTEVANQASKNQDDMLAIRLNNLLKDVLIYNLTSSEDVAPTIHQKIQEILENRQEYSLRVSESDLDLIIAHIQVILENKPLVDKLVNELISISTIQDGEDIYNIYNQEYEDALKTVSVYRFLMGIFLIFVISSISIYIILKLERAAQTVSAAKETLQEALEATLLAEEKYRSIFENSTDGIFQTTGDGKYISANPTLASIYGYQSAKELIETVTDIPNQLYLDPQQRYKFIANINKYGKVSQFESQVYRKDGSIIWISENGRCVKDSNGKILYYEGTVENISKRKRMETVLKNSETRLKIQQKALMELARCQPLYTGDINAAFREITETATRTLNVERASVWLYNENRSVLGCVDLYQISLNQHSADIEFSAIDYPAYFRAMEADRAITAHKARIDTRTRELSKSYLTPLGITSLLGVPILLGGRKVGVLCLEHIGKRRKWALEEENFASYLAYMASLSMEASERKQAQEALREEQEKVERLLLNILPAPIADRLKEETGSIADHFEEVTVLFADIVGFTQLSSRIAPTELVNQLNQIFSSFDKLADRHALEKIKTIGDAYMVVGGLPLPRSDHAEAIAEMAIDMQAEVTKLSAKLGLSFNIRIGINTGPVVAGVIGLKKFIYDLWGDTVNTASRMESHGVSGAIQVTDSTYQRLCHKYHFEDRGIIEIKGKGAMKTYLLKKRRLS